MFVCMTFVLLQRRREKLECRAPTADDVAALMEQSKLEQQRLDDELKQLKERRVSLHETQKIIQNCQKIYYNFE